MSEDDLIIRPPTPEVPTELIEAGVSGHLVVFVGAGASRSAGFPSWEGLLNELFEQAKATANPDQLEALLDYEDAHEPRDADGNRKPAPNLLVKASLIAQIMGDAFWRVKLVEIFDRPAAPTRVHQALAALPNVWIITTNYDRLMEQALSSLGRNPRVVLATSREQLSMMESGDVLKLHGDLDRPETLVLTREDYLEMSHGIADAWKERLKSWLQPPFQLLLVGYGYGYDDIDVHPMFQEIRYAYGKMLPGSFWLEKNSPIARTKAKADGLRLIALSDYDPVLFLESLKSAIQNKKLSAPIYRRIRRIEDVVYDVLPRQFEERANQARKLYEEYSNDQAILAYQGLLNDIQACLIEPADKAEQLLKGRQWMARCRLSLGGCYLSNGQPEIARDHFHAVRREYEQEPALLRITGRASLAEGLAALGEIDAANAVFPAASEISGATLTDQVRANIDHVRQELEIERGNIPSDLSQPWLCATAVRVLIRQADFEQAAQIATSVLVTEESDWSVTYNVGLALVQSLLSTIWEVPVQQKPIPLNRRKSIVRLLEKTLQYLIQKTLPQRVYVDALRLAARFYRATEHPLLDKITQRIVANGGTVSDPEQELTRARMLELARDGQFEEALSLLPTDGPLWNNKFEYSHLLFLLNRIDEARNLLQELSLSYPKRPVIDFHLAGLLLESGEHRAALRYARAAFLQFPGWGQRQLLAQCLLVLGQPWKAYVLLKPLDERISPVSASSDFRIEDAQQVHVLQIRAKAAGSLPSLIRFAPELFGRYLKVRPQDHRARIHRARLLWGISEGKDAAEESWTAVNQAASTELEPHHLYECALMQSVGGYDSGKHRDRVQQIIQWFSERYKGNATAEQYRFYLLLKLGMPSDREPFDIKLLEESGALIPVEQEKAVQLIRVGNEIYPYLHEQYLRGRITFESLCGQLDEPAAWMLTRIMDSEPGGYLCTPHSVLDSDAATDLAGSQLLCSSLELLLLQHLGLLHALRQALHPGGRLLLFSDVWQRIAHDAGYLQERASIDDAHSAPQLLIATKRAVDLHKYIGTGIQEGWIDIHLSRPDRNLVPPLRDDGQLPSQRQIWREDRCSALSYRKALLNDPTLRLLTAEFGVADLFPDSLAPLEYSWANADAYLSFARQFRSVETRIVQLPSMVITLLPAAERAHQKLCQLAELGFQGALTSRELLRLAKRYQGLGKTVPSQLLLRAEWQAREPEHLAFTTARMCLALTYAATIWAAFASVPRDRQDAMRPWTVLPDLQTILQLGLQCSSDEAEVVASTLMERIEALAGLRPDGMMDTFLQQLASTVVSDVGASGRLEGDEVLVSLDTPAGGLWRYLSKWAGDQGLRRSSLGRAIREVWLLLDGNNANDDNPNGSGTVSFQEPTSPQASVLQLGQTALMLSPNTFIAPEQEAVAILSTHWTVKPLTIAGSHITVQGGTSKDFLYEELLAGAAQELSNHVETRKKSWPFDAHYYYYQLPFDNQITLTVLLPVEAVFLRTPREIIQRVAVVLAQRQGIHDGRQYDLLTEIAKAPDAIALRRLYARVAVAAPWRQVREEASVIATWAYRRQYRHMSFPSTIADLRAVLSEEHLPLSSDGPPALLEILKKRIEQGIWRERSDKDQLYHQACEIPGWLPVATVPIRLNEKNLAHEVVAALERLTQPHNQPAARLAGDIMFLRAAAAKRSVVRIPSGVIKLRERLAERLPSVLQAMVDSAPEGTLAQAEAPILRLCAQVVEELASPTRLPFAEGLWLTYRLYQWLLAQMATLTSDRLQQALERLRQLAPPVLPAPSLDALNPCYFQSGRIDHRILSVLYALSASEQFIEGQKFAETGQADETAQSESELPVFTVSFTELETILIELASRTLTTDEESLRGRKNRPSVLAWHNASSIPDLSLDVLLRLDDSNILKLSSDARLRWIQQLPLGETDQASVTPEAATLLLLAFSEHIAALTPIEHIALEERLRNAPRQGMVPKWQWLVYTALFETGKEYLRDDVQRLLVQHLGDPAAPPLFGRYLVALAGQDPVEMRRVAVDILTTAVQHGHDAGAVAWGLGRVVLRGTNEGAEVATALIRELVDSPPYHDSPSMLQLLQWLNTSVANR